MSGGVILATVDENRKIEYLRQDRPLVVDGRARSVGEISKEEILVTISTSHSLVPGSTPQTVKLVSASRIKHDSSFGRSILRLPKGSILTSERGISSC